MWPFKQHQVFQLIRCDGKAEVENKVAVSAL